MLEDLRKSEHFFLTTPRIHCDILDKMYRVVQINQGLYTSLSFTNNTMVTNYIDSWALSIWVVPQC